MGTDVAERQDTLPQARQGTAITPADMLQSALDRGLDPESLQKFMDLYDRFEAKQAKAAFDRAMAAFKSDPPTVIHDMVNPQYKSTYSSLANLVNTVNASLSEHGLNANWDYDQTSDQIGVECVLSHVDGHSVRVKLYGLPDASGSKNSLQQIKSTLTYLRGATFEAVTGIASRAGNADDDGANAEPITAAQAKEIDKLIKDSKSDRKRFLSHYNIDSIEALPSGHFADAKSALERKKAKANATD